MYILVAHVFPLAAAGTRSRRQRSRRRRVRGAGRGPRRRRGVCVPAAAGCGDALLRRPSPALQKPRVGSAASGLGLPGKTLHVSGAVAGSWAGRARCGAAPPGGTVMATPRRVAQSGVFAITPAHAVISVLLSCLPESLQGAVPKQLKCCHLLPAETQQLIYFKEGKSQQRSFTGNNREGYQKGESDTSPLSRFPPCPFSPARWQPGSTPSIHTLHSPPRRSGVRLSPRGLCTPLRTDGPCPRAPS